jgi:hypothetical protein
MVPIGARHSPVECWDPLDVLITRDEADGRAVDKLIAAVWRDPADEPVEEPADERTVRLRSRVRGWMRENVDRREVRDLLPVLETRLVGMGVGHPEFKALRCALLAFLHLGDGWTVAAAAAELEVSLATAERDLALLEDVFSVMRGAADTRL